MYFDNTPAILVIPEVAARLIPQHVANLGPGGLNVANPTQSSLPPLRSSSAGLGFDVNVIDIDPRLLPDASHGSELSILEQVLELERLERLENNVISMKRPGDKIEQSERAKVRLKNRSLLGPLRD